MSSKANNAPPVRNCDRMRPVSGAELCHNALQVNFNRFLRNEEALTYFAIVPAGRYGFQHLDLTGRHAIFPHVLRHSTTVEAKGNSDLVSAVTIDAGNIHDPSSSRVLKFNTFKTLLIESEGTGS